MRLIKARLNEFNYSLSLSVRNIKGHRNMTTPRSTAAAACQSILVYCDLLVLYLLCNYLK